MNRKIVLLIIIFIVLVLSIFFGSYLKRKEEHSCPNCNVIVIDIDHLRTDAIDCSRDGASNTPNICKLVDKGINFQNNFSHHYWTLPSVTSTLTSLYPSAHKVLYAFKDEVNPQIPTLFGIFKDKGYSTAFVGPKEGEVIYLPKGFEEDVAQREYVDVDAWSNLVDELQKKDKPFFAFLYTGNLHIPYLLTSDNESRDFPDTEEEIQELIAAYLDDNPTESLKAPWDIKYAAFMKYVERNVIGDEEATAYMRELYDTNVSLLDKSLGEFIERITRSDLSKRTIVVLQSDHGDEFGEHNYFAHYKTLYNEVIKTPLVIYIPGFEGRTNISVTENIDIYPTLLDLVEIEKPEKIQGESLLGLIKGDQVDKSYAISEMSEVDASIQEGEWKLIGFGYNSESPKMELYNLKNDPQEQVNVVGRDEDIANRLLGKLKTTMERSDKLYNFPPSTFPEDIDEETRKRLIERGYF